MSKYQIIKGTTFGGITTHAELVGYDWDTGEPIFEETFDTIWKPHEEVISEFTSYNEAEKEYQRVCDEFMENHRWPWNDPHYEFQNGACRTEFTDNEDSYWFILKKSKEETEEKEKITASVTKDFNKMYWEMHDRYNPYPYQESRATIFGKAKTAGEIDKETYDQAREYFGNLWHYCGD